MTGPDNIFLIGPMGAGKSSVGKHLASSLNKTFLDSDSELVKRTGADIPLIFEKEGEEGFRHRESGIIDELTARHGIVLATGGGAILNEANRAHLSSRGFIIYLSASTGQILKRTRRDKNRPLLQTPDPAARLDELMAIRGPLYLQLADLTVNTDGCNVHDVVREILSQMQPST